MNQLPGTLANGGVAFAPTHWTMVLLSAQNGATADATDPNEALASLCRTYWPPLYTFVRRRGYGPADAQDLTQDFFIHLLETGALAKADRTRGRFRTFLLAALKNFLANAHERQTAQKRGGGCEFLPLDNVLAETEATVQLEAQSQPIAGQEDRQFEERWAAALVRQALEQLRAGMAAEGKERLYDELQVFVTGAGPLPDQAATAARLGLPFATLRTHIHRLRERYRDVLRAEVARTVATPAEVDDELRHLCEVLTRAS